MATTSEDRPAEDSKGDLPPPAGRTGGLVLGPAAAPVMLAAGPPAGLDPRARIELREMIRRLAAAGKTILVSSHILSELAEMCDVVGIIEQGRLIAVGTVDEIQRGAAGSDRTEGASENVVRVRVLDSARSLAGWLAERDGVAGIRVDGETVTFAHGGDRQVEADLLRAMVQSGFRVVEFGSRAKSLEDVFMQVTEGKVQ